MPGREPGGEQCGVFIRLYHGFHAGNVPNPYLYDTFLPVTFAPPAPPSGITVTPATGLDDGDTVTVSGTFPASLTGTAGTPLTTGVYLMYCVQPSGAAGTRPDARRARSAMRRPSSTWSPRADPLAAPSRDPSRRARGRSTPSSP